MMLVNFARFPTHAHDFSSSHALRKSTIASNISSVSHHEKSLQFNTLVSNPSLNRRKLLISVFLMNFLWSKPANSKVDEKMNQRLDFDVCLLSRIALRIQSDCRDVLKSSLATGRFLYRGGIVQRCWTLEYPDPDILEPGTYPEKGTAFFNLLEDRLKISGSLARPSTGHIAISNATEAGLWGSAHSCWPIGRVHYVWFQNSRLLYADGQRFDSPDYLDTLGIQVDSNLDEALRRGHEVLFTASSFILVPATADTQLRELLRIPPPG